MKKFDFILIIMACGLIGFGYYFSKKFKSDNDYNVNPTSERKTIKYDKNRLPSQTYDKSSSSDKVMADDPLSNVQKEYVKKYLYLKNCIQLQNCDFSQEDPRSYDLEIYQAINLHLKNVDILPLNLKQKVLYSAAKLQDGYVKESVLNVLINEHIYSEVWRNLVLNEYIGHYNSRLIEPAIRYLKENSSTEDKNIIHQRIFKEIANGSPKVANALAENLKIILDNQSASFYKSQISNLEEGPIKKNLTREITDFEMLASAG